MNTLSSRMTVPERKVAGYLRTMNIEWVYEQPCSSGTTMGGRVSGCLISTLPSSASTLRSAVQRISIMRTGSVSFQRMGIV